MGHATAQARLARAGNCRLIAGNFARSRATLACTNYHGNTASSILPVIAASHGCIVLVPSGG
jgi:hypothetical protein